MISVVVPLYNKEPIIEKSLHSVLAQDYCDFELVVVNDGSTDRSAEIVKSIDDSRIRLIEQENGGPSKARNTGVKNAKGEWIVFLDADDELLPGALRKFGSLIQEHPNIGMFGCSYITNDGENVIEPYKIRDGYYKNCYKVYVLAMYNYRTGCTIVKRDIALNNPFDEKLWRYEDLECYFRMHRDSGMYLDHTLVFQQNISFCEASEGRANINEDFVGHLNFEGKLFWERMGLYQLLLWEYQHYPEECRQLYPFFYKKNIWHYIYLFITNTRPLWLAIMYYNIHRRGLI